MISVIRLFALYVIIMMTMILLSIMSAVLIDSVSYKYRHGSIIAVASAVGIMLLIMFALSLFIIM